MFFLGSWYRRMIKEFHQAQKTTLGNATHSHEGLLLKYVVCVWCTGAGDVSCLPASRGSTNDAKNRVAIYRFIHRVGSHSHWHTLTRGCRAIFTVSYFRLLQFLDAFCQDELYRQMRSYISLLLVLEKYFLLEWKVCLSLCLSLPVFLSSIGSVCLSVYISVLFSIYLYHSNTLLSFVFFVSRVKWVVWFS